MRKRLQNKAAESKFALPVVSVYAIGIWLICGLIWENWWAQLGCFFIATYLMVQLNNVNVLIRIYSRMMSCAFAAMTCCACFLFPSVNKAIMEVCLISSLLFLTITYQDKQSVGYTYYAYLMFGCASIFYAQLLYFMPLMWLLTATQLQSLSWRTWGASLLGTLTPYWFVSCGLLWAGDFTPLVNHFARLGQFMTPFKFSLLTSSQIAFYVFICILALTGTIHFLRQHRDDKIRVRLIYGFFIWIDLLSILFLALQPQHYDSLIRISIIATSPLIAHFLTLTHTKVTNVAFFVLIGITLLLTGYNVWMFLSHS